jgi:hypothetical protein
MYIRKQRLLAPGPTPLYPHRTEDFRNLYKKLALADLKAVYGTVGERVTNNPE